MRSAMSMVELLLAIVVMGITLASAPRLIETATQSTYTGLQHESIAATSAFIAQLFSQPWDENNTDTAIGMPVLSTASWNCSLAGVTAASGRSCRGYDGQFYSASRIGSDGAVLDPSGNDDVDDFHQQQAVLRIYSTEQADTQTGNYIDTQLRIEATVSYGADVNLSVNANSFAYASNLFSAGSTQTSSIKLISVLATSQNDASEFSGKSIRLSGFVCNIGAPQNILHNIP